jgi:hypothetical protein
LPTVAWSLLLCSWGDRHMPPCPIGWDGVTWTFLPKLALNCDLPNLILPSSETYRCPAKIWVLVRCKWLTSVIVATWEAEVWRITVQGQPRQPVLQSNRSKMDWRYGWSSRTPALQAWSPEFQPPPPKRCVLTITGSKPTTTTIKIQNSSSSRKVPYL